MPQTLKAYLMAVRDEYEYETQAYERGKRAGLSLVLEHLSSNELDKMYRARFIDPEEGPGEWLVIEEKHLQIYKDKGFEIQQFVLCCDVI